MGNKAEQARSIISKTLSIATPDPKAERLVFRRFKGYALAQAAINGTELTKNDIQTVVLRVNPQQLGFTKRKIVNKIQTSAPGRFVVFDWGSELTTLAINGSTGMLLPDSITSGLNPLNKTLQTVVNPVADIDNQPPEWVAQQTLVGSKVNAFTTSMINNTLMNTSSYYELLNMSPKYKTFKALENMFDLSDADSDVITLELGDMAVYRGFFEEFSFDVVAEEPWNWKYRLSFVILSDLSEVVKRWDEQYDTTSGSLEK